MIRPSWDDTFIDLCFSIAKRSKDQSTKVGCVIVGPNKEPRAVGYNGIPRGCDDDIEKRHQRPQKYFYMEHAERNCIYNAARIGTSLDGCTLYVVGPPCADCARAIIQVGIVEIVCASIIAPERFRESCEASLEMLNEANITIRMPNKKEKISKWEFTPKEGWGDNRSRPTNTNLLPSTIDILTQAGWFFGRKVITTMEIDFLKNSMNQVGLPVHEVAVSFLDEFLNLSFCVPNLKTQNSTNIVHFSPRLALERHDLEWVNQYSKETSTQLCVIGEAGTGHLLLCIDATGRIFAGFDELLYKVGDSPSEALNLLCSGHTPLLYK